METKRTDGNGTPTPARLGPGPIGLLVKRLCDIVGSVVLLLVLLPLFLVVAVAIRVTSAGPVFFRQERIGTGDRSFRVGKFRTMGVGAERQGAGYLVERNDPRITAVGHWLRRLSIDGLPQLLNVVRGEMSLVGPRPTLAYQMESYDGYQRQRLAMAPGMAGLAQVSGRNGLSWPERIGLDVWYVQHWSFGLDLRLLARTVGVVLRSRGTYTDDLSKFSVTPSPWVVEDRAGPGGPGE